MRLVFCDDNRILCEALAPALEARGHQVLAIATTVAGGLAAVAELRPDAILLDLCFPGDTDGLGAGATGGVDAARALRQHHPGTAVMVLSGVADPAVWSDVLAIGVAGFLRKDQRVDAIADALDVIAAGGEVFDPVLSRRTIRPCTGHRRTGSPLMLTPREKEVLSRIVAGQSTGQMAHEMNIAASTLRGYVKNVLTKLGAHSRLQAAALATRGDLRHEFSA